ncbi:hypothetical protein MUO14_06185 [Halobacillus shinanisalinarum]|uniref:Integral membrane protein n=1 Tax=Halobacillus shinanisalinarum TaxID=2932258 RepID=A0ABY4H271_9BACI|nr:hypothetical protein [Halobacillus shinanisalinarum]UOQ94540.1 hypothetical protein MUO14_06185 [Halobacillus shinanisalinarum]
MAPIFIVLILVSIIALGEVLSLSSRAKIPTLLVVIAVTFVLLQTGILPESYIEASTFVAAGGVLVPVLIVHLGTMIPLSVIKKQYKAVLVTLIGLLFSVGAMLIIISLIFDYKTAVAGAGPLTGGIIAYIVTQEGLTEAGFTSLAAIPVVVFALQNLVGMPLTSTLLSKYAVSIRDDFSDGKYTDQEDNQVEGESKTKGLLLPDRFMQSNFFLLFLLFIGGALATWLGEITGINYSLWSLAIGIMGFALRIYPDKALDRSNSSGLAMVALIIVVVHSLVGITWDQVVSSLVAVLIVIVVGTTGLVIGGMIGAKIFKWKPTKAVPIVLTALYGFPGDYLIVEEVSRSIGRNEAEQKRIMDELLAPMLIGGFTSVTVGSIVIASILIGTL